MLPAGQACAPEVFSRLLAQRSADFGLTLSDSARDVLAAYLSLLDAARRRTNLTGTLTTEELADHALESALGGALIALGARLVDVGSGAGFPGVPLAITRPDLAVTLVEPRRKRLEFLREATGRIGAANVTTAARLAELAGGSASIATARAVGDLDRVLGEAPFLEPAGAVLVWTTDPVALGRRLGPRFRAGRVLSVPGSRSKAIAEFRRIPEGSTWNTAGSLKTGGADDSVGNGSR